MFKSQEFQRSAMPLIIANSIFSTGLLEYSLDRTTQMIGSIYAILSIIAYYSLFYFFWNILKNTGQRRSMDIVSVVSYFQFLHNSSIYIFLIAVGFVRRKKIQLSVMQLENCSRAMHELGIPGSYSAGIGRKYFLISVLFFSIIFIVLNELMWAVNGHEKLITVLFYCIIDTIPPIVIFIVDLTFVYWIRYTKIKFGQLNVLLRSMLTTTIDFPQHRRVLRLEDKLEDNSPSFSIYRNYRASENVSTLRKVKHIHLELTKCARSMNKAYGSHILISMTRTFVAITVFLYYIYDALILKSFVIYFNHVFVITFCLIYFGFEMLAVNHICAMATIEVCLFVFFSLYLILIIKLTTFIIVVLPHAATTSEILFELYEPSATKEFRDEVYNFSQQLLQNPLTFTACGFFNLDYTFIHSAIGSITTYLVILIQVGSGPQQRTVDDTQNSTSTY